MQAELIFTGTELLLGEVLNTHAQYLSQQMAALGIEVILHTTVGDNWDRLAEAFEIALRRADLIVITGGLGPTSDDLTKDIVARVLGLPMLPDGQTLQLLREFVDRRGSSLSESMVRQAYFPAGARVLPNPAGTAPGALLEYQGRIIILLPGPPRELKAIFEASVVPYLISLGNRGMVTRTRLLKITGISESEVQERIGDLGGQGNPGIAYLARPGEVHVRISAQAPSVAVADRMIDELLEKVRQRLADYVFGMDDEVLEEVVGKLLVKKGLTCALAESCTGGLVAARLTSIPGSSAYFWGSVVAYDNRVKEKVLGVPAGVLETHGAVSRPAAIAMAEGVRNLMGTHLGLSVTGIAGPGGGTPVKPVGLTYIALATAEGTTCQEFHFPGHRQAVRQGAANAALNMIRLHLLEQLKAGN
ncbi:competence/damage-inducible protein A [Desulfofundulus thermocisternus]|uniref:competence/damage-inducible protein A n=1 Tax=Desulfofundulus thermocisternus TaxID=42471 RepID=UPI0019F2E179|nr:competence/damage-inducible protein A [Desulfofundulus thermocisternus]MBE3586286.1 competence/damage-inducible protein A [Thermoanaerobacter sp.]MCS5695774.1 competence/damage-inducible protein A [Desulfofundulus thermocisternus]